MKKTGNIDKLEEITSKLEAKGLERSVAEQMAIECMSIAYKKTVSSKALSYEEFNKKYGGTVKWKVFNYLKEQNDPVSRQDIAYDIGYKLSTVCGKVHELIKLGYVVVCGTKEDPETGYKVQILKVA